MKNMKRISCLMLVLLLALCMGVSSFAMATSSEVATEAGKEAKIEFTFTNISAINGTFAFDNPDMISDVKVEATGLIGDFNKEFNMVAFYGNAPADCVITLTLSIADTAQTGDECNITFTYESIEDGYFPEVPEYHDVNARVYIDEEGEVTELDYTALIATIEKAKGLDEKKYTPETWAPMIEQLKLAEDLVGNAETQDEINAMTTALQNAIDALKPIVVENGDTIVFTTTLLVVTMGAVCLLANRRKLTNR